MNKLTSKRIEIYRSMSDEQRLLEALRLTELVRQLMIANICHNNPGITEEELKNEILRRMQICRNLSYSYRS